MISEPDKAVAPILILGTARSGTTWLGNILVTNPQVAGAHHWLHWGIAESRLKETADYAGDLTEIDRLIHFIEVFAGSDYFKLVNGDKAHLYRAEPANFTELFFELMDHCAKGLGVPYWVTKLDPQFLYRRRSLRKFLIQLDARYPDSLFVSIERPFREVIDSYLKMEGTESIYKLKGLKRTGAVAIESARFVCHNRTIRRLMSERRGLSLRFEELTSELDAVLGSFEALFGVPFTRAHFEGRYPPNTSNSAQARGQLLSPFASWVAGGIYRPVFQALPFLPIAILRTRDLVRRKRPPFYWRLQQFEQMSDRLLDDLHRTGQTNLLAEVKKHLERSAAQ